MSGLLALLGIEADPLSSPEHIRLANLIDHAGTAGLHVDLAALVGMVQDPPTRKLGVLELDSFYPKAHRTKLALKLNGLRASPAFASWNQAVPLDIERLLYRDGRPGAAIISIAHLGEQERQFVVTLVLSELISWMRRQPGTSELRALVYMDEVFGFVPPTANPPAKKPILTVLKQARAFGVGLVLASQNPVDLDYRAISNAGTWWIGRLQTEQDKARLMDGLRTAAGSAPATAGTTTTRATGSPAPDADATPVMPEIADGTEVTWLDPAAEWVAEVEAVPGSTRFEAAVAARVHLLYDETKADDLRHEEEYECVLFPLSGPFDPDAVLSADYDDRDLRPDGPDGATYGLVDARVDTKTWFSKAETALRDHLVRSRSITIQANRELKVYGRPGESDEDFRERCAVAADAGAEEAKAKIAARFEKRRDTLEQQYAAAQDRGAEARMALEDKQDQEKMNVLAEGANSLGGLPGMGGRRRSVGAAARRASSRRGRKTRAAQRLTSAENRVADKLAAIEELEISLEKSDVTVDDLQVVWIPR